MANLMSLLNPKFDEDDMTIFLVTRLVGSTSGLALCRVGQTPAGIPPNRHNRHRRAPSTLAHHDPAVWLAAIK